MKQIVLIAGMAVFAVSCSGEQEGSEETSTDEEEVVTSCQCTELFFDEAYNRFYLETPKDGFTGTCEDKHPNGETKLVKDFKDGKVHGKMISYYDNGQKKDEREFEENFQVGEQISYNRSGEIVYHALYKRGKLEEILVTRPDLKDEGE